MNDLALKMLLGDRAKYIMLVSGLTFASLLMTEQAAIFCGIMQWSGSTLDNVGAPIWVVDPMVEQVNDTEALRDTDLHRVRSVEGVAWAAPFYQGVLRTRMRDGSFKFVQLVGIDAATFAGAPAEVVEGDLNQLRLPNTVILDEYGAQKLSRDPARPIAVGDSFEINDHEARVVGICRTRMSFSGNPYVFTTYDQALQYAPGTRKMLSCVLVGAAEGKEPAAVARRIGQATGLKAYTRDEFFWLTVWWFIENTGIPVAFGATVLLGFVVGLAISSQTFYSFVLENLRNLGALKAMGASDRVLARMVMLQTLTVGLIGYGCGVGLASLFGMVVLRKGMPPFFLPWQLPLLTLGAVLFICWMAASLGIRKIRQLEPAVVFRG
ncbi:MAG: FtsX-like permease family protein [Verrucomicrobiales bacterium]|nr:FtsX-like permease family protein [Verrucomicrobiales bacterium]